MFPATDFCFSLSPGNERLQGMMEIMAKERGAKLFATDERLRHNISEGPRWLSPRASDSEARGPGFEPHNQGSNPTTAI